jgi:hypothetical protein
MDVPMADRHDVERAASMVYGIIVASSVLAAGAYHLSIAQLCLAVVVTVVVYWLAEIYARVLASRALAAPRHILDEVRDHAVHHWRMVTASFIPLAALLAAAALGADEPDAVLASLVLITVMLAVLGWVAAGRAGMRAWHRLAAAAASSLGGLVMIGLKFALH